ncbi:hypothetical protein V6N11_050529 [Hibiscus sabdariffa]|uniref:Tf2-1-like SH3-like domain-containing protein n=1 Tax=Hibiscus sabdariffa TaxID=183260 RepID=A0ABR2TA55_9ROSI
MFLKVSPWEKVMRFGRKRKLSSRFIGPYEIVERVSSVTYQLLLPPELERIHDVFHMSMLRRTIELVKVKWRHRGVEEATWERNDDMMDQFPYLFPLGYFGCESDVKSSYNVELLFAASFDSKMGCLCSVFAVKKQGKLIWEVRTRYWKLREGENRVSVLLEGISVSGNGFND